MLCLGDASFEVLQPDDEAADQHDDGRREPGRNCESSALFRPGETTPDGDAYSKNSDRGE
jgi:hypothetical protein